MVPNSSVLSMAVMPLREPDSVDLLARLRADIKPSDVQTVLDESVSISTRARPQISLEEIDGDEVVVRVAATPQRAAEGPKLADEILAAVASLTRPDPPGGAAGDGRGQAPASMASPQG